MSEPIRVFIGTEPAQKLPTEVLKHSILRRTKSPVEFTELSDLACGVEGQFFTGFSFYRWYVPWFCDFKGRAIYLDADIVCLCDLAELWNLELSKSSFLALQSLNKDMAYTSVMLIDCAKAHWDAHAWAQRAAEDRGFYRQLMWCRSATGRDKSTAAPSRAGMGALPEEFNALDTCRGGHTKLLHYTEVNRQPWRCDKHPYGRFFWDELKSALQGGLDPAPFLDPASEACAQGDITASILKKYLVKKEPSRAQ